MQSAELIRDLERPDAYPHAPSSVTVRQTHVSMLFFADDHVYKVKKPVDLGFLDFSTPQLRRRFCEEEVRLNRRLAPDVYLGVVEIVRDRHGRVRIGGPGEVVDHAVHMVRLPDDRMLNRLVAEGAVDAATIDAVVSLLVRFHAAAVTGPGVDEHGTPPAVRARVERNLDEVRRFAAPDGRGMISAAMLALLRHRAGDFLDRHEQQMRRRAAEGRVREGHGDLHAGNICIRSVPDDIVIYDCIEFDRALRCGDVACDLAFLVMDLESRGAPGLARRLAGRYADLAEDPTMLDLLPLYGSNYAAVRGKVNAIASGEPELPADQRARAVAAAMRYFDLAAGFWLRPALVLMCGLPGTGKSHLARCLARPLGAEVIRSDELRKLAFGLASTQRWTGGLDTGPYTAERTEATYERMLEMSGAAWSEGRAVVVDATFARRAQRERFLAAARERGVPGVLALVGCADEIVRDRLRRRAADPAAVSDADEAVYEAAAERFDPPGEDELGPGRGVRLDGAAARPEHDVRAVVEALIAAGSERR